MAKDRAKIGVQANAALPTPAAAPDLTLAAEDRAADGPPAGVWPNPVPLPRCAPAASPRWRPETPLVSSNRYLSKAPARPYPGASRHRTRPQARSTWWSRRADRRAWGARGRWFEPGNAHPFDESHDVLRTQRLLRRSGRAQRRTSLIEPVAPRRSSGAYIRTLCDAALSGPAKWRTGEWG